MKQNLKIKEQIYLRKSQKHTAHIVLEPLPGNNQHETD